MKILQKLMMLAVLSVFLPGVAFAHPDMSNRRDAQRILYAAFLDAFFKGANGLEQKFHDGRTYSVNITNNNIFERSLGPDRMKQIVVRFEDANKLIALWTLANLDSRISRYMPKFNRFRDILEILETAVEDEKFPIKKAIKLAHDAKKFNQTDYSETYERLFQHADGDDALLTTDLQTLGDALIADIKARKKSKEINKAYVNDVDHLFDGKHSTAQIKKSHLPDMQRSGRFVQHYTLNVDKAEITTFELTDAGIKVTPELGDIVPTNGNGGGGNQQSPLADQAIEKFNDIRAIYNNDPIGFLNLILLPGSGQNTTNREFLNLLRPATIFAINKLKLGADLANKSIQAKEPNAAQATADLTAITDQLLAIKERLNLTNNGITNPSFEITQAEFGTAAIPDPTDAKGLLDQAAAFFVGASAQSDISGFTNLMQSPPSRFSVVEGIIRTAIALYNKAKALDPTVTSQHPLANPKGPNLAGVVALYNALQLDDSKDITGFTL